MVHAGRTHLHIGENTGYNGSFGFLRDQIDFTKRTNAITQHALERVQATIQATKFTNVACSCLIDTGPTMVPNTQKTVASSNQYHHFRYGRLIRLLSAPRAVLCRPCQGSVTQLLEARTVRIGKRAGVKDQTKDRTAAIVDQTLAVVVSGGAVLKAPLSFVPATAPEFAV